MSERLAVAVAEGTTIDRSQDRSTAQPVERQPAGKVERDDELDPRQREIEPPAVRGVEHPPVTDADRLDPSPLLLIRDRHPARLPGQIVHGVPGDARGRGDALRQDGLP